MLSQFLMDHFGGNAAPVAAVAVFVVVVGASLWLTPRLARWIDERRKDVPGFYDGMHEQPPEEGEDNR